MGKKHNKKISQAAVKSEHRARHFASGALLGMYFFPLFSYFLVYIVFFHSYFRDDFISFY